MVETLLTVAIILVLGAVAGIMVYKYQRTLEQLELDNAAKEIFAAAQNHLSASYSQGYLAKTDFGTAETEAADDGVYYFIVGGEDGYDSRDNTNSVLSTILPFAAIDETVLSQGSYIIRYFKDSGTVLDVFYAKKDGARFGTCFTRDNYEGLLTDWADTETESRKTARLHYTINGDDAVIGYYGGAESNKYRIEHGTEILAPSFKITNGDELTLTITDTNAGNSKASLNLYMHGESSGVTKTVPIVREGSPVQNGNMMQGTNVYTLILDSITKKTSGGGTMHFMELYGSDHFLPGENLTLWLEATSSELANTATSGKQTTNSLFADYSGNTVEVSSFRHLENLSYRISGFTGTSPSVSNVKQITDLTWDSSSGRTATWVANNAGTQIFALDGSVLTESGYFDPVYPADDKALNYQGQGHIISGVKINTADPDNKASGLFAVTWAGSYVSNLELVDFQVDAGKDFAGALVGIGVESTYTDVLVHNSDDIATLYISARQAGGLAGYIQGSTVNACAAAVYVRGVGSNSRAGGLIGGVGAGNTVKNSYAGGHTYLARYQDLIDNSRGHCNVISDEYAGGLIGMIVANGSGGNGSSVTNCYSTCSVYSSDQNAATGGLIGFMATASVTNCYCTGRVSGPAHRGYFVGNFDPKAAPTFSGTNYYLKNISVLSKTDKALQDSLSTKYASYKTNVVGVSGDSTTATSFVLPENKRQMAFTYDSSLTMDYAGKFYFPTVDQLAGSSTGFTLTSVHYGDWQIPKFNSISSTVSNEDTLTLSINVEQDAEESQIRTIAFSVLGEQTGIARLFKFSLSEDGKNATLTARGFAVNGATTWLEETTPATGIVPVIEKDAEGKVSRITIILDSVTDPGQHFKELFADDASGRNLKPGENIIVQTISSAKNTNFSWSEFNASTEAHFNNSLFKEDSEISGGSENTAAIGNIRHLQNLATDISGVDPMINKAVLAKDISWNGTVYAHIYAAGKTTGLDGKFLGIRNDNLRDFDGQSHFISGLPMNGEYSALVAAYDGGVGLFRTAGTTFSLHDLQLKDLDITGGTHVGYAVGYSSGNVTLTNVLGRSQSLRMSGTNVGGLVGTVGSGLVNLNNCAATVLMNGGTNAGGLVGTVNNGTLKVNTCYAGGHTQEGEYEVSAVDASVYNVIGGSNAGGIVGLISSGTSVDMYRSFSATSVSGSGSGAYSGGLIGRNFGSVTLSGSVYNIAPVYKVGVGYAGALIGSSNNVISVDANGVYYLPEVYGRPTVAIGGSGDASGLGGIAKLAFYELDQNNAIAASAELYKATLAYRTIPYDDALLRDAPYYSREFPYSVWTTFNFAPENGNPAPIEDVHYYGIYYGDWEPVDPIATDMRNIDFGYLDPRNGNTFRYIDDRSQWTQKLILGEDNTPLVPYIAGMTGYNLLYWSIYDAAQDPILYNGEEITLTENNGSLKLLANYCTEEYCDNGIILVAHFSANNEALVSFNYDPSGANRDFVTIGQARAVEKGTLVSSILPTRTVQGYSLEGWYTDRAMTQKVNLATATVQSSTNYYAKFVETNYHQITVDFLYEINGIQVPLYSVPRYQVDGQPQYKFNFKQNTTYDENIDMPATLLDQVKAGLFTYKSCANYAESDTVNTISYTKDAAQFHLHATGDAHFYILYEIDAETAYEELDDLVHFKIKYVYLNSAWEGHAGEVNGTGKNWKLVGGTGNVWEYKYEGLVDMVGNTPNIKAENISEQGLVLLSVERKPLVTDENQNVYEVEYERPTYAIVFNPQSGIFDLDPITGLKGGQEVNLTKAGVTAAVRDGYTFNGWKYVNRATGAEIPVSHSEYNHTHKLACYSGIDTTKQLEKKTRTIKGEGCDGDREETYYTIGNAEVQLGSGFNFDTNATEYTVQSYTQNGTTKYVIRYNGKWYAYSNPKHVTAGTTAPADQCTYTADVGDKLTMPNADVEALAQWKANTDTVYRVAVWYENADDTDYSYMGSSVQTGTSGATISSSAFQSQSNITEGWKDSSHFTYNGKKAESKTIKGDGSTVLNVYFTRNSYTLYFDIGSEHVHSFECYSGVSGIGTKVTKSGSNYYIGSQRIYFSTTSTEGRVVNYRTSNYGSNVGKLVKIGNDYYQYTGTVSAGSNISRTCSSVVYSITAKYMSLIKDEFPITTAAKKYDGYSWIDKGERVFSYALQTLDRMPDLKGAESLTFTAEERGTAKTIHYYVECLNSEKEDITFKDKRFVEYKTVKHNFRFITRDEEFHLIEGFDRYAYTDGSSTPTLYKGNEGEKEYSISNNENSLYYIRKSYPLEFYVGSTKVAAENVQFGESLNGYSSIEPTVTRPSEVYTWGGWYLDPDFTGEPVNLSAMTMPLGGLALYGRWVAPTYTVRFFANKTAENPYTTYTVELGHNLDGIITDNSGAYLPGIIPTSSTGDYFNGFYDKANNARFLVSVGVTKDMDLYAKFGADYTDFEDAVIHFRYETMDGTELSIEGAPKSAKAPVGDLVSYTAPYTEGYYPVTMVQSLRVSTNDADNWIVFRYKPAGTWKYNVETYIRLGSLYNASGKIDGHTAEPASKTYDYLMSRVVVEADSQYVPAYFDMPDGYENYLYLGYEFNGTSGTADMVTVYPTEASSTVLATVRFYITPDTNGLSLSNQHYKYDNTPKGQQSKASEISFTLPSGMSGQLTEIYDYYYWTEDGIMPIAWNKIIDVGRYDMEGYLLYQVTGKAKDDSGSVTRYFLLWQSAGKNLSLTVAPRYITLVSESAVKTYDGSPLKAEHAAPSADSDSFLEGDSVEILFSVEAFRLNQGVSLNSFTYRPLGDCKERLEANYVIETRFGTLTVNPAQ